MIVKVATMQRDEAYVLEPWLRYHGYLFGFENLHVHDNGSEKPAVLDTLARYRRLGVSVHYGARDSADFNDKGVLIGDVIRRWDEGASYDCAFPVDCDEFVGLWENGRITCRRSAIMDYLATIRHRPVNFKVDTNLFNIPGQPGWFWPQDGTKTFFAARTLRHLDHGYHFGSVRSGGETVPTSITYFHLHFKPYAEYVRGAREKLAPYVDVDDPAALRAYAGAGVHLVDSLLNGQEAYDRRFEGLLRIHVPEFGQLLGALGDRSALSGESVASLAIPELAMSRSSAPMPDEYEVFDREAYLRYWGDVAATSADPLLHYVRHGIAERRRILGGFLPPE